MAKSAAVMEKGGVYDVKGLTMGVGIIILFQDWASSGEICNWLFQSVPEQGTFIPKDAGSPETSHRSHPKSPTTFTEGCLTHGSSSLC